MQSNRVSIPNGTRDFSPSVMEKRNYIFNTIRIVYEKFGFKQIETPAMENLSTLMGKYGEEGNKLIYKILNSGDLRNELSGIDSGPLSLEDYAELIGHISEKDLARFPEELANKIKLRWKHNHLENNTVTKLLNF